MWIGLGFELGFINADKLFSFTRVFAEAVVSDAIEPGGKFRFTTKAADVFKGLEKRFLSEVIGERGIGAGKLTKQTPHGGLMTAHQLGEGMVIVFKKNPGDEVCIGQ